MTTKPSREPLPFGDTLRDLALLRASDVEFSSLLPPESTSSVVHENVDVSATVTRSYEFVKETRTALKINHRRDVEKQGTRVEDVRSRLEDVLEGLGFDK